MNAKEEYAKKLKDPRWQKLRLKKLEDANWRCQRCGDGDNTLHVHHLQYADSGNPWDVSIWELEALCEACHKSVHNPPSKSDWLMGFEEGLLIGKTEILSSVIEMLTKTLKEYDIAAAEKVNKNSREVLDQ